MLARSAWVGNYELLSGDRGAVAEALARFISDMVACLYVIRHAWACYTEQTPLQGLLRCYQLDRWRLDIGANAAGGGHAWPV
jgi:hypothetical protein